MSIRKILAEEGLTKKAGSKELEDLVLEWFRGLYVSLKNSLKYSEWADIRSVKYDLNQFPPEYSFSLHVRDVATPDEPIMDDPKVMVDLTLQNLDELKVSIRTMGESSVRGSVVFLLNPMNVSVEKIAEAIRRKAGENFESSF